MTKKKTTKESSSSRLSESYRFKRALRDTPAVSALFKDRNDRVNRIRPIKNVLVFETSPLEPFMQRVDVVVDRTESLAGHPITEDQKDWPFRIEYIEQLLEVTDVWTVVVQPYYQDPTIGPLGISDISIDVTHIKDPVVSHTYGSGRDLQQGAPMTTEAELMGLERIGILSPHHGTIFLRERYSDKGIDIMHCNILPYRLGFYNATFYRREVAQLYVDSLSEHLRKNQNGPTPKNYG